MVERYKPEDGDESFLAWWRKRRGVTQPEMAKAVGVSVATYRRLERGEIDDPGVRVLHNCAIALGVRLEDILPAQWMHWTPFAQSAKEPPVWEEFWQPERAMFDEEHGFEFELPDDFAVSSRRWVEARRRGIGKLARLWGVPGPGERPE